MKATKTTTKILNKIKWNEKYYDIAKLAMKLEMIVDVAENEYNPHYAQYTECGLKYNFQHYEDVNLFNGLANKYPDLFVIYCTHDLQYVIINNINKLVKLLAKEAA